MTDRYHLMNALNELSALEEQISDGEINLEDEAALTLLTSKVAEHFDAYAINYKMRIMDHENRKSLFKDWLSYSQAKLDKHKDFLKVLYQARGKIKTPNATLYQVKRDSEKVLILDFDAVMKAHPHVVTYYDEDNVRKITLNKTELKKVPKDERRGFDVVSSSIEYPVLKLKEGAHGASKD